MSFDGKARSIAQHVRSSHSKKVREANCRRYDKLCSMLSEAKVWELLREVRKAADMARSLRTYGRLPSN